jgi:hypothetical protein
MGRLWQVHDFLQGGAQMQMPAILFIGIDAVD